MTLIDNGIYVTGRRTASPTSLDETHQLLNDCAGTAWIGLYRPDAELILSIANEFSLHPLAMEDALKGNQRSKLERFGDMLFVVLRPARYLDIEETVDFGEINVFIGPEFAVTVRHAENPALGARIPGGYRSNGRVRDDSAHHSQATQAAVIARTCGRQQ